MADLYTDAQLSDGTTLRFQGQLTPDQVRNKVAAVRLKRPDLAPPPSIQRPQVDMETSALGYLGGGQETPQDQQNASQTRQMLVSGLTGMPTPNMTDEDRQQFEQGKATGALTATAIDAAPFAPRALPFLKQTAVSALKAAPYVAAAEGINYARQKLPGGRFIPPGAELLPFFMGGGKGKAAAEAETVAPEVKQAESLRTGGQPYQDPAAGLGELPVANPGTPAPIAAPPVSRTALGKQLENNLREAVGNKPIQPGVPLRNQWRPQPAPAAPTSTSEMTPVEGSSAVKAFRYDAEAQELHVTSKDGTTYVSGEVTPDQAFNFAAADSKGQAWKAIRDNNVLVAKIPPGGKRIAVKPTIRTGDPDHVFLDDPQAFNQLNKF